MASSITHYIRPNTKRNGSVLLILGVGGLALVLAIHTQIEIPWPIRLTLCSVSLVMFVLGVGKLMEPEVSFEITPQQLRYLHFRGSWQLDWSAIQRFDIPSRRKGLDLVELPFLGIRLRSYDAFLGQLSPRLAVHLMYQQRPLMLQLLRTEMPTHRNYLEYVEAVDYYVGDSGQTFRGVIATFAKRMTLMREMLGYDLFVPQNAFDRPLPEFIAHLKALQATRQQYLDEHEL